MYMVSINPLSAAQKKLNYQYTVGIMIVHIRKTMYSYRNMNSAAILEERYKLPQNA
jgi:hypothetical protein